MCKASPNNHADMPVGLLQAGNGGGQEGDLIREHIIRLVDTSIIMLKEDLALMLLSCMFTTQHTRMAGLPASD